MNLKSNGDNMSELFIACPDEISYKNAIWDAEHRGFDIIEKDDKWLCLIIDDHDGTY